MHRPDGIPDAVEQVKHGVLQTLGQIKAIGHPILRHQRAQPAGVHAPGGCRIQNRRPHLHRRSSARNEVDGNYSGKPDDRWAFTGKSANLQWGAAASLAAAARRAQGLGRCAGQGVPGCRGEAVQGRKGEPDPGTRPRRGPGGPGDPAPLARRRTAAHPPAPPPGFGGPAVSALRRIGTPLWS